MSTLCLICKRIPDGKVRGDGWYCAVLHNGNESYEWLPNIVGTEL